MTWRVGVVIAVLAAFAAFAPTSARADTTITFDDVSPGTLGNQYAARGVTFRPPVCFDAQLPNSDVLADARARSTPNLVEIARCASNSRSSLVAEFSSAQTRVSVYVRNLSRLSEANPAVLTATDGNAEVLGTAQAVATNGAWTLLSVAQPAGQPARIRAVTVTREDPGDIAELGVDDFSFGADAGGGGGGQPGAGVPGSPGGGGAGGGRPAQAAFTANHATLAARQNLVLDASRSFLPGSQVRQIAWDLGGGPGPEATCGPEAPVLETDFTTGGARTVRLTVTDATGARTTASRTINVAGGVPSLTPSLRRRVAALPRGPRQRVRRALSAYSRLIASTPSPAVCRPRSAAPPVDVTGQGGPGPGCVSELQIPDTLISAVGCLREVQLRDLPSAERSIINTRILGMFAGLGVPLDPASENPGSPVLCRACARTAASLVQSSLMLALAKQQAAGAARFWIADPGQAVRINGLDYRSTGNRRLVIVGPGMIGSSPRLAFPAIVSSGVSLTAPTDVLGPLVLRPQRELVLPIRTDREIIAEVRLRRGVPFAEQTKLRGVMTARLRDKASDLVTQLALPFPLTKPGGGEVTGAVTLRTSNREGMRLAGFEVRDIDAEIFGVGIDVKRLRFETGPSRLDGDVRVSFLPVGEIDASIGLADGRVTRLRADYFPGPPGIKVGPGIFIDQVGADFRDNDAETRFIGRAGLAAGTALPGGCAPVRVLGQFDFQIEPKPVTLALRGDMSMACIALAYQQFVMAADGYAEFSAGLNDFKMGPVELTANWGAAFYDGKFTAEAAAKAKVDVGFDDFEIGGSSLLSDRGLAMCAAVDVLLGEIDVGFGLDWSPPPVNFALLLNNLSVMAPSCDVGPWRTVVRRAQAGPATFEVQRGQRAAVVGVRGARGAPLVTLRDPSGRARVMPPNGILRERGVLALCVPGTGLTTVFLARPAAGRWTVEAQGDRITELRRAPVLPKPQVRARVSGRGASRLVSYRVTPAAGQTVHLLEQAPGGTRELGVMGARSFRVDPSARGSVRQVGRRRGEVRLRLTPSGARGSNRALVALVEQNGLPRDRIVLDRFRASPPRPGRVRGVRARWSRRGVLTLTWRRTPGAGRYIGGYELSDGRARMFSTRGRRLRIGGVKRGTVATVRVLGASANSAERGRATRVTARAVSRR